MCVQCVCAVRVCSVCVCVCVRMCGVCVYRVDSARVPT